MSLISLLLALSDPAMTRHVNGTACPATQGGVRLGNNQVIDGPPSERAILRDDGERRVGGTRIATWKVGYIYAKGRQVHLLCEYAGQPAIVVKVNKPVKQCRYTERRGVETLSCR